MARVVGVAHVQWSEPRMYALGGVRMEICNLVRGACVASGVIPVSVRCFRVVSLGLCAQINAHALEKHLGEQPMLTFSGTKR